MGAPKLPGDVKRLIDYQELPASVRELDNDYDAGSSGILMKHQIEATNLSHIHNLLVIPKGRRTGITYAFGKDDAITAASDSGDNIYYIGDTKEKGLEYIGYVAHMARVMDAAFAEDFLGIEEFDHEVVLDDKTIEKVTAYRIRFASGNNVVALSSNPANIRGLQGLVRIDEAAFHRDVQGVIDAATALLIWGGKIVIISTHNGAGSPFNQLVKDARAGLNAFKVFEVTFDDAVANGLYERVCMRNGWTPTAEGKQKWYLEIRAAYGNNKEAMLEELDAIPREGSGVAIPRIWIEACMPKEIPARPVLRVTLDKEFALKPEEEKISWGKAWIEAHLKPLMALLDPLREHCFGSDYARHRDFSVITPAEIGQDLTRNVPFIIEMHNIPTRQQEQILWYMIDHLPRFTVGAMDATGNGQTIAEYTADKYGHDRIHQITLNNPWYKENMNAFQNAFEDQSMTLPVDRDIENDIAGLRLIDGIIKPPKITIRDIKQPDLFRHLDSAVALALMWYASRQDAFPIDFESLGQREMAEDVSINSDVGFGSVGGGNDFGGFMRLTHEYWWCFFRALIARKVYPSERKAFQVHGDNAGFALN